MAIDTTKDKNIDSNTDTTDKSVIVNNEDKSVIVNLSESQFIDNTNTIPRISLYYAYGKQWMPWADMCGSESKNYPNKLLSLFNNSALHCAICTNTAQQIAGKGFTYDQTSTTAQQTTEFLQEINSTGQDVNELLERVSLDLKIFNGFCLLVTWSRDWTKIAEIEHVEINKIRTAKPNVLGNIPGYWYSFDWASTYRPQRYYIPAFDPSIQNSNKKRYQKAVQDFFENNKGIDREIIEGKENTQLLYFKRHRPDCFFYPLPDYAGALTSIESDIESDQFALNSLKNSMSVDYFVNFITKETKEGKQQIVREFQKSYVGAKSAGKPLIGFSADKESQTVVTKLDSPDADKRYLAINENSMQKILAGHRITNPQLVGIIIPGKLGGTTGNDITVSQELFYNTVIQPYQMSISKVFNKLMKINGLDTLSIIPNNPFNDNSSTNTNDNNNEIQNK